MSRFLDTLHERVLVLDGAMGTMLQRHKLEEADFRGTSYVAEMAAPFADAKIDVIANDFGDDVAEADVLAEEAGGHDGDDHARILGRRRGWRWDRRFHHRCLCRRELPRRPHVR